MSFLFYFLFLHIFFFTRDVEKSVDPVTSRNKEHKTRPMSLDSVDITADDDDESVDMDHVGDPER